MERNYLEFLFAGFRYCEKQTKCFSFNFNSICLLRHSVSMMSLGAWSQSLRTCCSGNLTATQNTEALLDARFS